MKTKEDIINDLTKDSNGFFWGAFAEDRLNPMFFIADKEFNVVFQTPAFDNTGNWTVEVKEAMRKFGIIEKKSRMRTDNNIEALKESIELDYRLWQINPAIFPEKLF